jgi:hypothetical protein
LEAWLDPDLRKPARYGPFTLDLPHLPSSLASVERVYRDGEAALVLRTEGDREALLAWLKGGGSLDQATGKVFESLRGRLLTGLLWEFCGTPIRTLRAEALNRREGEAHYFEKLLAASRGLTPEDWATRAGPWLRVVR